MRYKPKTIEEQGGLYAYLDLPEQRELHRGFGSRMWRILRTAGLNKTALMKAFNVRARDTIDRWIEQEKRDKTNRLSRVGSRDTK